MWAQRPSGPQLSGDWIWRAQARATRQLRLGTRRVNNAQQSAFWQQHARLLANASIDPAAHSRPLNTPLPLPLLIRTLLSPTHSTPSLSHNQQTKLLNNMPPRANPTGSARGTGPTRGGRGGARGGRGVGPVITPARAPAGRPGLPDASAHITTVGVKRTAFGSSGRAIQVSTNHFEVKIPEGSIYHYDGAFLSSAHCY